MEIHGILSSITDDSGSAIAKKIGVSERTILHQIATGRMPLKNVIAIAEAYGYSPVRALVDAGELKESWSHTPDIATALHDASDEQLTNEFLRRLKTQHSPEQPKATGHPATKPQTPIHGTGPTATNDYRHDNAAATTAPQEEEEEDELLRPFGWHRDHYSKQRGN